MVSGLTRILAVGVFGVVLIVSVLPGGEPKAHESWTRPCGWSRIAANQTIAQLFTSIQETGHIMNSLLAVVRLILLVVVPAAPAAAQGAAVPPAELPGEIAPYLNTQRLVYIAGGRTIDLVCLGQGSPTVVLTAGLGGWSVVWNRIQSPLSRRTCVCAWDPAGLGFSSPSPDPQDAIHKTEDLEEALRGAHLDGPT